MKLLHERAYSIVASNMTDSKIGARKKKSVRNHTFVLNSIISDVLSSTKKTPVDLLIMDFKHMFDPEESSIALNALYETGTQYDIIALLHVENQRK